MTIEELNQGIDRTMKALDATRKYSHLQSYVGVNRIELEQKLDELIDAYVDAGGKCLEN